MIHAVSSRPEENRSIAPLGAALRRLPREGDDVTALAIRDVLAPEVFRCGQCVGEADQYLTPAGDAPLAAVGRLEGSPERGAGDEEGVRAAIGEDQFVLHLDGADGQVAARAGGAGAVAPERLARI